MSRIDVPLGRVKDERQASTELPPAVAEHMQAVVARSGAGGDSRILDVGAGTGILVRFLQGAGVRQVGVFRIYHGSTIEARLQVHKPKKLVLYPDFARFPRPMDDTICEVTLLVGMDALLRGHPAPLSPMIEYLIIQAGKTGSTVPACFVFLFRTQEHFVGVDLSSRMVDVAKMRYPRATFVQVKEGIERARILDPMARLTSARQLQKTPRESFALPAGP